MSDTLTLLVQKLGHELVDIRVRAFENVVSKLDLNIITLEELAETEGVFDYLVGWFKYKEAPLKESVGKLILRLLKVDHSNHLLLRADPGLETLRKSLSRGSCDIIDKITALLPPDDRSSMLLNSNLEIPESSKRTITSEALQISEEESEIPSWLKWWHLPRISLIKSDQNIISAVYESLCDENQLQQATNFFTTVIIHDFPPQVFLQNPAIVKVLVRLLRKSSNAAASKCLIDLTLALRRQMKFYSDPNIGCPQMGSVTTDFSLDLGSGGDSFRSEQVSRLIGSPNNGMIKSLSVPEFCILMTQTPSGSLICHAIKLFLSCLRDVQAMWESTHFMAKILQDQIRTTFHIIGDMFNRSESLEPIERLKAVLSLWKILVSLVPAEVSASVVPEKLQKCIFNSVLDPTLPLLYPDVHQDLYKYTKYLEVNQINWLDSYLSVHSSIEQGSIFITNGENLPPLKALSTMKASLYGLPYHQDCSIISKFITLCLEKWELSATDEEEAVDILLKLLAFSDDKVKLATYREFSDVINSFVGPNAAIRKQNLSRRVKFLLNAAVFQEVICYGLTSSILEVVKYSENVLLLVLKCNMILPDASWCQLISDLSSVFPYLHAFGDNSTLFGKAVFSMLDPDIAREIKLPKLELLKGNIRLLFSKSGECKSEATRRLIYLLDIKTEDALMRKLTPPDNPITPRHTPSGMYEEGSMIRILEVLNSTEIDCKVTRAALTQLSIMIEDSSLHKAFEENNGPDIVFNFLKDVFNKSVSDSSENFGPIIAVLKNIARNSEKLRHYFSIDYSLISLILRGLYTLEFEWRVERDIAQLIALLAFSDVVVSTPETISFPFVLSHKLKLPFASESYGITSSHALEFDKDDLLNEKAVVEALSLKWAVCRFGGLSKALMWVSQPEPLPPLLPLKWKTVLHLQESHVSHNVSRLLSCVAVAVSHTNAIKAIYDLNRYLEVQEMYGPDEKLSKLEWYSSFSRYFSTQPANKHDQEFLLLILQFLCSAIDFLPPLTSSFQKLFKDPSNSVMMQLVQISNKTNAIEKDTCLAILKIAEKCMRFNPQCEWQHLVGVLVDILTYSHTQQFYSLALLENILVCLCLITKLGMCTDPSVIELQLLWKLLQAFHCTTPSSWMGVTITKFTVTCINHLLGNRVHKKKGWEKAWLVKDVKWLTLLLECSDNVLKAAALQLLSGLCYDNAAALFLTKTIPGLWEKTFSLLISKDECYLVRSQAAVFCSNLFSLQPDEEMLDLCVESIFFRNLSIEITSVHYEPWLHDTHIHAFLSSSSKAISDIGSNSWSVSTPEYLYSALGLITNLFCSDPEKVASGMLSQGLGPILFRHMITWRSKGVLKGVPRILFYSRACHLLTHLPQQCPSNIVPDALCTLVWMLHNTSFGVGLEDEVKVNLWTSVFNLMGSLLAHFKEDKALLTSEAVDTLVVCVKLNEQQNQTAIFNCIPCLIQSLSPDWSVRILTTLLEEWDKKENSRLYRMAIASLVGASHAATENALKTNLLPALHLRIKSAQVSLAVVPSDIPRNRKSNSVLNSLCIDIWLMNNLLAGSIAAKEHCASVGLADSLHKLWAWCLLDHVILAAVIQCLITFTANCVEAAHSLALTSTMMGVGQRKNPTTNSLLHASISLLSKEVYPLYLKQELLEILAHACQSQESRIVLCKSNLMTEFLKLSAIKRSATSEEWEVSWLRFLTTYTYYVEGQVAFLKCPDGLDLLLSLASSPKLTVRSCSLDTLMNLSFHGPSKQKLFSCDKFLSLLGQVLMDDWPLEEKKKAGVISWSLAVYGQKGKSALRASGIDSKLQFASTLLPDSHPLLPLLKNIVAIIKPSE